MGKSTALRQEIKQRFYPVARERGFVVDASHPMSTDFRRLRPEATDVFDLQWDKHHLPRFRVNFGRCPAHGVHHLGKDVPPERLLSYMGPGGVLRRAAGGGPYRAWFRQDRQLLLRHVFRIPNRPAGSIVDQLLDVFPQLDAWYRTEEVGTHIEANRDAGLGTPLEPRAADDS